MGKINVAELLKNCPKGMELDCAMYDNLYFDSLNADYYGTINCYTLIDGIKTSINFTKYGTFNNHTGAKCVIFPKGKTTWEGFQRPFKDGDILAYNSTVGTTIFIHRNKNGEHTYKTSFYVGLNGRDKLLVYDKYSLIALNGDCDTRLATEEEKAKLFDAIKDNGYRWNPETKTLEKLVEPKFKVGDRIKHISAYVSGIVVKITNKGYHVDYPKGEGVCYINFTLEKDYELAPNKFDITTLVPFESRVLIRDSDEEIWHPGIWGFYNNTSDVPYPYRLIGDISKCCIPYKGNEHLLGTTNDCDEFYKTWK